jgi:two-component system response regulator RegX3
MTEQQGLALVIDDAEEWAAVYSKVLEIIGFETAVIGNGNTAVAELQKLTPVLVLLDLHLPGVSGRDILAFIREQPHLTNTKVILITADIVWAKDLREKADMVLIKPMGFQGMLDAVNTLMSQGG